MAATAPKATSFAKRFMIRCRQIVGGAHQQHPAETTGATIDLDRGDQCPRRQWRLAARERETAVIEELLDKLGPLVLRGLRHLDEEGLL